MLARAPAPLASTREEPSLALPRSFWKNFARQHWDRQPTVFRGLFQPAHFPSTEDIFSAFVEASARFLRGEFPPGRVIRFFVEHEDSPDGRPYYSAPFSITRQHLPLAEDKNAETYLERVTRTLGGKRFGLVLNRGQAFDWNHWQQLQTFLTGFHEALGVPLGGSDTSVFFGNYQYTPFGIHKDDLHIFYFVIQGKKTLSLWPFDKLSHREELPKRPDLIHRDAGIILRDKADEEQLLAQATFLEGQAGDLMYWPASYWHRAEPSKELAISSSLGVCFRPPEFAGMPPMGPPPVPGQPGQQWPERLRHTELPDGRDWRVPASVRKSIQRQSRRENLLAMEREQTAEWARFLSSGALAGAAPEATGQAPLSPQDWIRTSPSRPVVSVPLPGGQVLVAANGHATTLSPTPAVRRRLERLVSALNSGKPQHVEALEDAFFSRLMTRSFSRRAFRALLDDLVRWRAVRRCEPSAARR
jgi:hypothetical protein